MRHMAASAIAATSTVSAAAKTQPLASLPALPAGIVPIPGPSVLLAISIKLYATNDFQRGNDAMIGST